MDDDREQAVDETKEAIGAVDEIALKPIPFSLLDKRNNKTTKLHVNSGEVVPVKGKQRPHEFLFRRPYVVFGVAITTTGYPDGYDFDFEWIDGEGRAHLATRKVAGGVVRVTVNSMCRGVVFTPPFKLFDRTISSVRIDGLPLSEFGETVSKLATLEDLKADALREIEGAVDEADEKIEAAELAAQSHSELLAQTELLEKAIVEKNGEISNLNDRSNELISKNSAAADALEAASGRLEDMRADTKRLRDEKNTLTDEVAGKTTELKGLQDNINLFPSELASFVTQGSKNAWQYFWLAIAPIIVICVMFGILISGAVDLSTLITPDANVNIEALIVSRVPYVAVAITIITACYKIARSFIMEIMRINKQRLDLTKISIIAKDVSASSEAGLNISDEQLYRLRTAQKMNLLKSYMASYLGKDYVVELPKSLSAGFPMLADPAVVVAQKAGLLSAKADMEAEDEEVENQEDNDEDDEERGAED